MVSVAFRVTSCKFPKIMKLYFDYDLCEDAVSVPECELECGVFHIPVTVLHLNRFLFK